MNRLQKVVHVFWPWLEKRSAAEQARIDARAATDEPRIAAISLARAPNVALDEVRRLADREAERRRGTEQKAATYLPLVAALIPLILTVVGALWDKKAGSAPVWMNMVLLGLAVAYTAWAGRWAFKALKVGQSHEPGLGDFETAWGSQHPTATLAGLLLLHTRRNQDGIDWKVSCIMMAHEFLLRAFFAFSFLLILNIAWSLATLSIQWLSPPSNSIVSTPQQALAAVAQVESLTDRMKATPAWAVLEEDCRRRTGHQDALRMVPGPEASAKSPPAAFKQLPGEQVVARRIQIDCSGKSVAQIQAWYLPKHLAGEPTALPVPLGAPTSPTILSVQRAWPPKSPPKGEDVTKLPMSVLRQVVAFRTLGGQMSAFVVTDVGPGAVDLQ